MRLYQHVDIESLQIRFQLHNVFSAMWSASRGGVLRRRCGCHVGNQIMATPCSCQVKLIDVKLLQKKPVESKLTADQPLSFLIRAYNKICECSDSRKYCQEILSRLSFFCCLASRVHGTTKEKILSGNMPMTSTRVMPVGFYSPPQDGPII